MELLLATHNLHKVQEIQSMLTSSSLSVTIKTLADFPNLQEVDEDAPTLEGNAVKKAASAFERTGLLSLADDTGLECYYLELRPGVRSARYAGDHVTYSENNEKLLNALSGVPPRRRTARFRSVIAIVGKGIREVVEGKVEGVILEAPRGNNGFGYDPLFTPVGFKKSYAEMALQEKNEVSHRSIALRSAIEVLKKVI
jgi:XTP/dITP diphosphohydrolase